MNEAEINNLIQTAIANYFNQSQYKVAQIPSHVHNGKDSPLITTVDLPTGTPIKLGLGGLISTSNSDTVAPGSSGEIVQTSIVSGKDAAGNIGTTTNNLQFNLLHQPQNASNQSFITAFRPPLFETAPGTTISVTATGNTVTITGYAFTTNSLANALINIADSSGAFVETQTIASNTATVITIAGTWLNTTNNGTFIVYQPVFLGSAGTPWQRVYTCEGTGGGVRFGVGPTNGGQNGLLYMDSTGDIYWRNKGGSSTKINGGSSGTNGRSGGSGVTTIANTTPTKVTMTNGFVNGITWDNTNKRFTILTAGQYSISAQIAWQSTTQDKSYYTMIYKNGSLNSYGLFKGSVGGNAETMCVSDVLDLAINDYIELWCEQTSGGNETIYNDSQITFMAIAKV